MECTKYDLLKYPELRLSRTSAWGLQLLVYEAFSY
jgi:hypothetical protein